MGHKINLNISTEWKKEVVPIIEEWKKENSGNASPKICESIVFMKNTTSEKIYQAIMAYDLYKQSVAEQKTEVLQDWEKRVIVLIQHEKDWEAMFYMTKSSVGPLLPNRTAAKEMLRLRELAETIQIDPQLLIVNSETPFERLVRTQSPLKYRWGQGDFDKAKPGEAYEAMQSALRFIGGLTTYIEKNKDAVDLYRKAKDEKIARKRAEWLAEQQAAREAQA